MGDHPRTPCDSLSGRPGQQQSNQEGRAKEEVFTESKCGRGTDARNVDEKSRANGLPPMPQLSFSSTPVQEETTSNQRGFRISTTPLLRIDTQLEDTQTAAAPTRPMLPFNYRRQDFRPLPPRYLPPSLLLPSPPSLQSYTKTTDEDDDPNSFHSLRGGNFYIPPSCNDNAADMDEQSVDSIQREIRHNRRRQRRESDDVADTKVSSARKFAREFLCMATAMKHKSVDDDDDSDGEHKKKPISLSLRPKTSCKRPEPPPPFLVPPSATNYSFSSSSSSSSSSSISISSSSTDDDDERVFQKPKHNNSFSFPVLPCETTMSTPQQLYNTINNTTLLPSFQKQHSFHLPRQQKTKLQLYSAMMTPERQDSFPKSDVRDNTTIQQQKQQQQILDCLLKENPSAFLSPDDQQEQEGKQAPPPPFFPKFIQYPSPPPYNNINNNSNTFSFSSPQLTAAVAAAASSSASHFSSKSYDDDDVIHQYHQPRKFISPSALSESNFKTPTSSSGNDHSSLEGMDKWQKWNRLLLPQLSSNCCSKSSENEALPL